MTNVILEVKNLNVEFTTDDGIVHAVNDVSYTVERGKTLAIVGESGSGKSVSSLAVMGLLTGANTKISGEVFFNGKELIGADPEEVRKLRGDEMAMIFQDPLSALHPYYTIGDQLAEAVLVHNKVKESEARSRAAEMLTKVGIPSVEQRMDEYPHQLSGGMRMRASLARSLVMKPKVFLFDEPFGALDEITRERLNDELLRLFQHEGFAGLFITHSITEAVYMSTKVLVMSARPGKIIASFDVPFTYPRNHDLRYEPEFGELCGKISHALRGAHE